MRTRRNAQKGLAAVEFALILPLLLSVLLGIMEWGYVFLQQFNVASAVRDGVRFGVTQRLEGGCAASTAAVARTKADLITLHFDTSNASITSTCAGVAPSVTLTVSVSAPYRPIIGFVPTPAKLGYSMTMLMENQN